MELTERAVHRSYLPRLGDMQRFADCLLAEGADPELRDDNGHDALAVALACGQAEIATLLSNEFANGKEPFQQTAETDNIPNLGGKGLFCRPQIGLKRPVMLTVRS